MTVFLCLLLQAKQGRYLPKLADKLLPTNLSFGARLLLGRLNACCLMLQASGCADDKGNADQGEGLP